MQITNIFERKQPASLLPARTPVQSSEANCDVALEVVPVQQQDELLDGAIGDEARVLAVEHFKAHCKTIMHEVKRLDLVIVI